MVWKAAFVSASLGSVVLVHGPLFHDVFWGCEDLPDFFDAAF